MPITTRLRRPLSATVSLLAVTAMVAACGDDGGSTTAADPAAVEVDSSVLASTSIWSDVTTQVACGELEVPSIIPLGVDAHEYEPAVQDADALLDAQLIVVNGLELEEGLEDALSNAESDGVAIVEVGEDVTPVETGDDEHADEEHGDEHGGTDPHVWMDPARVAEAVPTIAGALADVDGLPVDADQIEQCADDYLAELDALQAQMDEAFGALPDEQRNLVTNHEALGYLADGFGFEVIGTVIPSTSSLGESNARDLDELAATMQEAGVTRIFGEVTGSREVADALAERMDGEVEVVALFTESLGDEGSGAESYLEMMRTNTALITGAR